jgi:hypothetical protein
LILEDFAYQLYALVLLKTSEMENNKLQLKTINEIIEHERTIPITLPFNYLMGIENRYSSNQKRGTNKMPKKKKRK